MEQLNTRIANQTILNKLLFHCQIPMTHHMGKKNNRPILKNFRSGKSFIGKSKELQLQEKLLTMEFRRQALVQELVKPIDEPIWVIMHFYFEDFYTQQGKMNLKLGDLSNLYGLPEDALQDAGIISNDALIMSHDLSRKLPGEKNVLELFILKYDEDNARLIK